MIPRRPTLPEIRRLLQRDGRIVGLEVRWSQRPSWTTYPTGVQGWLGRIAVAAPGYRARTMVVERDEHGTSIR